MMPLRLMLSPEQTKAVQPFLDAARVHPSPGIVVAQVLRLDWTEGAHLVLEVSVITSGHG